MPGLRTWLLTATLAACAACTSHAELIIEDAPTDSGTGIAVPQPDGAIPDGTAATQPQDPHEAIYFTNGDILHGQLSAIIDDGWLAWTRDDVEADMTFSTANLLGLRLRRGFGTPLGPDFSRVEITNGDAIFGRIISMDDNTLNLATPYAGILKIRKNMIRALYPGRSQEPALFAGPGRLEDWIVNNGNQPWQIKGGKLQGSSGYVGRDVNLPDMARLTMDIEWNGRSPAFMLAMYTDSPKNSNSHSYNLTVNSHTMYMNRNVQNSGNNQLGNQPMRELANTDRMHLEVLLDRKNHTVSTVVDGKLIKTWNDPKEFPGNGSSLIIYAHDNSVTMSFSNIRVTTWDGKLPGTGDAESTEDDMIAFANDDRVHGFLKSIQEGKAIFETKFAPGLEVPLERIARIQMSASDARSHEPRKNKGDVQLYFANGGRMTLQLQSLTDRTITGYSETFGDVQLSCDAFVGLRFNLYKSIPDDQRDTHAERLEAFRDAILR